MTDSPRFVLLTAAKNEEKHIGLTIESVLSQTVKPCLWLITDDGSTDKTAEIVTRYSHEHPFIQLRSNRSPERRSFGAQYRALVAAYQLVEGLEFDFVGVLDADIELPQSSYFKELFSAFDQEARLGITGGYIHERARQGWARRRTNAPHSVAGAVQMFRRSCYEQIGGYRPQEFGGEDWLAQIEATAAGWSVRSITNLPVRHHRPTSSAEGNVRGQFRLGMRDASFGSHLLFEMAKCARRIAERPFLASATIRFAGYAWYRFMVRKPALSPEQIGRVRQQQIDRVLGRTRRAGAIGSRARS